MEVLNIPTTTTTAQLPLASDYSLSYSNTATSSAASPVSSFPPMSLLPFQKSTNDFCQADLLKCGSCATEFLLSDIVVFIQHKTKSCKQANSAAFPTDFHHGHGSCCNNTCNNPDNLACSSCSETFKNPKSLLEHAQFTHKINIFIENKASSLSPTSSTFKKSASSSPSSSSSASSSSYLLPKVSSSSSIFKKTSHHHINSFDGLDFSIGTGNGSSGSSGSKAAGNGSSAKMSSTNEIFIDVIPSNLDRRNSLFDKNPSYNITFSSSLSPSSTSSSLPKSRSVNSHLNITSSSYASPEKKSSDHASETGGKDAANGLCDNESGLVGNSAQAENGDVEKSNGDHHDMENDNDDDENENHSSAGNEYCNLIERSDNNMKQRRNLISLSFQNENSSSSSSSSTTSSRSSSASSSTSAHSTGSLTISKFEDEQDHEQLIHSSSKSNAHTPTKLEAFDGLNFTHAGMSQASESAKDNENGMSELTSNSDKMMDSAVGTSNENSANQLEKKKDAKKGKQTASFYCNVCSAAFNQKIHLTKHSAKHTGIKPFKCSECSYSTVERSHLKVHVRVHTGEKPFKCTFCEYATAQSSTLKIHKKRHHNNLSESKPESLAQVSSATNTQMINNPGQANDSTKQEPTSSSTSSSPAVSEMSNEEYLTKKKIAAKRQHQSRSKDSTNQKSSKKLCNMNMTNLKNTNNYLTPNVNAVMQPNNSAVLNLNSNLANMAANNVNNNNNHLYTSLYYQDVHEVDQQLSSQNFLKFFELLTKNANGAVNNPPSNPTSSAALNIGNLQPTGVSMQNSSSKFFESLNTMLINNIASKPSMPATSLASIGGLPSSAMLNPYFTNSSSLLVNNSNTSCPTNRSLNDNINDPFSILKENRLNLFNPLMNASNVRFSNNLLTVTEAGTERKSDPSKSSQTTPSSSSSSSSSLSSTANESSSESSENKLLGLANIALEREIN